MFYVVPSRRLYSDDVHLLLQLADGLHVSKRLVFCCHFIELSILSSSLVTWVTVVTTCDQRLTSTVSVMDMFVLLLLFVIVLCLCLFV